MRAVKRRLLVFCAVVFASSLIARNAAALVWGDYLSNGYNSAHDNPFQQDPSFVGNGFDLSGVGVINGGGWVTMISDTYFLSAYHANPTNGGTQTVRVDFFKDFKDTVPDESAWVDQSYGVRIGNTDLWVGRLTTAPSAAIKRYPLISRNEATNYLSYVDPKIYVVGYWGGDQTVTRTRMGVNKISGLLGPEFEFSLDQGTATYGSDAALTVFGDSTGPTFVRTTYGTDGTHQGIALAGIHHVSGGDSSVSADIQALRSIPDLNPTIVTDLPGDFNGDWKTDFSDFGILLKNWNTGPGKTFAQGDANGDGYVNFRDFNILGSNWNRTLSGSTSTKQVTASGGTLVPEPATLALVGLVLLAGLAIRPRRRS